MLTEGLAGCRSATAQGREHYAHQSGTEGVCMSARSVMECVRGRRRRGGGGGAEAQLQKICTSRAALERCPVQKASDLVTRRNVKVARIARVLVQAKRCRLPPRAAVGSESSDSELAFINLVNSRRPRVEQRSQTHPLSEPSLLGTTPVSLTATTPMSALRKALPAAVRELRVFGCQQSPGSEGVR